MNIELIRKIVKEALAEANSPASPKPTTAPPTTAPGKPKPRRPLGNPDVKPNPKAMNEDEMLNKIVARFKSKQMDEAPKTWAEGYEEGYNEGYNAAKTNKANKFSK